MLIFDDYDDRGARSSLIERLRRSIGSWLFEGLISNSQLRVNEWISVGMCLRGEVDSLDLAALLRLVFFDSDVSKLTNS